MGGREGGSEVAGRRKGGREGGRKRGSRTEEGREGGREEDANSPMRVGTWCGLSCTEAMVTL